MIFPLFMLAGALVVGVRYLLDEPTSESALAVPSASQDAEPAAAQAQTALVLSAEPASVGDDPSARFYLAIANVGIAAAGALVFAPLGLLSVPITLYCCSDLLKEAYRAVFKQHRLTAAVIDAVTIGLCLATGLYVAGALSLALFIAGRKILAKTEDHTLRKLVNIFGEQPKTVWLIKDDVEIETAFEQLQPGDVVVVKAGQVVPVDGIIRRGTALIDQHMLTGESQPVERGPQERVCAATILLAGRIYVDVEQTGAATMAAQVGTILHKTADYRDQLSSRGERIADHTAWPMLGIGTAAFALMGPQAAVAALSSNFLVALRLTTPLSMLNFLDIATQNSILIKDGRALELLHEVDTVVFDKTGTLTLDRFQIGKIHPYHGLSETMLLTYAAAAEIDQSHPIARAIVAAAQEQALVLPPLQAARYEVGAGLKAQLADVQVRLGSARFLVAEGIAIPDSIAEVEALAHERGSSCIYVAIDDRFAGVLELYPTVRPEVPEVISALHARGLSLYMISGDHPAPTRHLAKELGIDHYFAEVSPADKATLVADLQKQGRKVCFIGDGINDSIALKQANASISLLGATTIAQDTAQIVMMDGTLRRLPQLFKIVNDFDRNTRISSAVLIGPSALSMAGVFLFKFNVYTAILLWNLSLATSLGNAMLPALTQRRPSKPNKPALTVSPAAELS